MIDSLLVPHRCYEYPQAFKPCPFCGELPLMKKTHRWPRYGKYANRDTPTNGYTVVCVNYKCLIFDADNQYAFTPEKAAKAWEKRAK